MPLHRLRLVSTILSGVTITGVLVTGLAAPATAQTAEAAGGGAEPEHLKAEPVEDGRTLDIVVTGDLRSEVIGDIPPLEVLTEADIARYGASSLSDLIRQLATRIQNSGGRGTGQPVVLMNGRHISGIGDVRDFPPEAIARVEILPPEVALSYGFGADQRVVNVVLKDEFSAWTLRSEVSAPSAGGRLTGTGNSSLLRIVGPSRINISINAERQSALLESDRAIIQAPAGDAALRTLLPSATLWSVNGSLTRPLSPRIIFSFNLRFDKSNATSLSGRNLDRTDSPLAARSTGNVLLANMAGDGQFGLWRWSLNASFESIGLRIASERNGVAVLTTITDHNRQTDQTGNISASLNGPVVTLPAGAMRTTVSARYISTDFASRAEIEGQVSSTHFTRTLLSSSVNIDVPVTSRQEHFLGALGNISANLLIARLDVSDFGRLNGQNAGLRWGPTDLLNLHFNWLREETAPSISQLRSPTLVTPLRTTFDFSLGETVLASVVSGGNPALLPENRRDFRLQASWRPIAQWELLVAASYARLISRNSTTVFPILTPEIEAAFPDRVMRDSSGRVTGIDQRPINFSSRRGRQLSYGLNCSKPFGQAAGGGRWSIGLLHTIRLQDDILIRQGVPVLDLLDGSATGSNGGTPRHTVELDGGWFFRGMGVRVIGNWREGSTVVGGPVAGGGTASNLTFSPQMTINLRMFMDLNQRPGLVENHPVFRNSRIRLAIDNLFNDRQTVRDANGIVPLRYQQGYLDPAGRTFALEFRKQF